MTLASLALVTLLAQAPDAAAAAPAPSTEERLQKALDAAQKAAEAAQKAAEAAQKAAEAAQKATAAPAAPAEEKKEEAKPPSKWSGSAGIGFVYVTGNANSVTFAGNAAAQRKSDRYIFGLRAFGAYGQTTPTGAVAADTVALNAGLGAQFDYRFIPMISMLVGGGLDTDHLKSIEIRGYGELGVGVIWLDRKEEDFQKLFLRTDLTFRIQQENRHRYFPTPGPEDDVFMLAPRVAAQFRYALNKSTAFQQDVELMPNVVGASPGRLLINATSKLSARLLENIALAVSFQVKYDSRPATARVPTDTATMASIEAVF